MTDLELTKACAEEMGFTIRTDMSTGKEFVMTKEVGFYHPLGDDAQAMALLYWLMGEAEIILNGDEFHCNSDEHKVKEIYVVRSLDMLRRAIVECVAQLKV